MSWNAVNKEKNSVLILLQMLCIANSNRFTLFTLDIIEFESKFPSNLAPNFTDFITLGKSSNEIEKNQIIPRNEL